MYAESTTTQGLFFIPVLVVYPYQTPAEGEYFAIGVEKRVMYLSQWWADEARHQHRASKDAQCHSGDELEVFHRIWKLDRFTARPFALLTEGPFLSRIRSNDFFVTLAE